ncbi:MAG: hypothetical protein IT176_04260 [Acidobacteria bacterium]|nr:hypothetical protein [Acidobacteriota bacterium]
MAPAAGTRRPTALIAAPFAYLLVAIVFSWPLALHLRTQVTGPLDGDTGVYVWNLWVFHHELLDRHGLPYFTSTIFGATGPANLSLHNYTAFANIIALPFVGTLGIVATFNLIYLGLTVMTAFAMFLLAERLTGDAAVSWLAGLLFAWCPTLIARSQGHFSLVAAAPLPVMVLVLLGAGRGRPIRDAAAIGATVAWATACDVYFGVYCLMLAVACLTCSAVQVSGRRSEPSRWLIAARRFLDVSAIGLAGLIAALAIGGGWEFALLGQTVRMRTLYTPVLVLTALVALRLLLSSRRGLRAVSIDRLRMGAGLLAGAGVVAAILMSPLLYAFGVRVLDGQMVSPPIFWRSSPPGLDLAALVVPNPNHPLAPAGLAAWLDGLSRDGYIESVGSISLVALAAMIAAWRAGWRPPLLPLSIAAGFGLLALGPFIRIAGLQTYVPGPWAFLRYLPVVGLARSPARFLIFAMVGVAALFASSAAALARRWPHARRWIVAGLGALLVFELFPAPRPLFSARIPSIYRIVQNDPRPGARVLELPFGVRDGTMTVGNFTARTQYYQTAHGKPILGGYLSRVSERRVRESLRAPVLRAMIRASEGQPLTGDEMARLRAAWPAFIARTSVAYIVLDAARGAPALRPIVEALDLEKLGEDPPLTLYRPRAPAAR